MFDFLILLYPFTAFLFVRVALRAFAIWSVQGGKTTLTIGGVSSVMTFHAGYRLYEWAAVLPHWWIAWLITAALAWVIAKNVVSIWKFESIRIAGKRKMPVLDQVVLPE